jgi:hypothetical protein
VWETTITTVPPRKTQKEGCVIGRARAPQKGGMGGVGDRHPASSSLNIHCALSASVVVMWWQPMSQIINVSITDLPTPCFGIGLTCRPYANVAMIALSSNSISVAGHEHGTPKATRSMSWENSTPLPMMDFLEKNFFSKSYAMAEYLETGGLSNKKILSRATTGGARTKTRVVIFGHP